MAKPDRTDQPPQAMRCLVITLSDRAAAGVYADRSGPRIRELLEDFFVGRGIAAAIEQCLLPDDAEQLRGEIVRGVQQGVDVIFTTGGTGVGPRNITPDTVAPLCDRLIPGIMEHIRGKFGGEQSAGTSQPCDRWNHRENADLYLARQRAARWKNTFPKSSPRWNTSQTCFAARTLIEACE